MEEITQIYKQMVIDKGFNVAMDSEYCKIYKSKHETCAGCESEDGCNRYCALGIINLNQVLYKPVNYADYLAMQKDIQEKIMVLIV